MSEKIISSISKNYAQALVETACENNSFDYIKSQLEEIIEIFKTSNDLKIVLENSSISLSKKIELLDAIFVDKIDLKIINLLKILVEKNRIDEFESIYYAYETLISKYTNQKRIEIISATILNENLKNKIIDKLQKKLECEILPSWQVDNSIIAGLVIKFDDNLIDTSVRTKLENLSKNIMR
ncbi:ATP synthase F1 subunit delta [bacterium]|nr:ATP synthase F1 subunit delta [bacterium]